MRQQLKFTRRLLRDACSEIERGLYLPFRRMIHASIFHHGRSGHVPKPGEVIWIDPRSISGHMRPEGWLRLKRKTGFDGGALVGGDWDDRLTSPVSFTSREPFQSCNDHWVRGRPWNETAIYQKYVSRLQNGPPCRFASLDELWSRYQELYDIFHEAKQKGSLSTRRKDLIKVSIARDGRLIWGPDGRHRICIAICAGLNQIPASVGFIHIEALETFAALRFSATSG